MAEAGYGQPDRSPKIAGRTCQDAKTYVQLSYKPDGIATEDEQEGEAFEEQGHERPQQEHADAEASHDGEPAPADSPDDGAPSQVSQVISSGFVG